MQVAHGYIDAVGWARSASGHPLSNQDACGTLPPTEPPPTNQAQPRDVRSHPLAAVTSKFSHKYFHWLVEGLPRVALLLETHPELRQPRAGKAASKSLRLLVSCKGPVLRESLALLGVDRSRVLCWRFGRVYTTPLLIWPPPAPCGGAKEAALRSLRFAALPASLRPVDVGARDDNGRIIHASGPIILHKRDGTRQLTNHDKVLHALRSSSRHQLGGAPIVELAGGSNRTLRDQIELFRGARCQVGPHGAGMALMLFAPERVFGTAEVTPGAYFVSIRGKPGTRLDVHSGQSLHLNRNRNRTSAWVGSPTPNACYRGLAATLGMRHEWLIIQGATANEDLTPEPEEVVRLAASVCG